MLRLQFDHVIECDPDRFWAGFFDGPTVSQFYTCGIGFRRYAILLQVGDEKSIHREVHCLLPVLVPRPLRKLFGAGFEFVERGDFDKNAASWTFRWTPSILADRLKFSGRMHVEARPPASRCQRIVEIQVDTRVQGVGGLLENIAARVLRQSWDDSATVLNQWLANGLWGNGVSQLAPQI